jgi:hypothetical protein
MPAVLDVVRPAHIIRAVFYGDDNTGRWSGRRLHHDRCAGAGEHHDTK